MANEFTIKSRKLNRTLTFNCAADAEDPKHKYGYIWVDLNGQPGCLGRQICEGGCLMGNTLMATEETFEQVCRNWYRAYIRRMEAMDMGE